MRGKKSTMKQGNGSEILDANDPRSAEIGIIHVSPTDDRQGVLAAILTQERLGRKQVVVELPEDNKAFRSPVDFDGLKKTRRGMQAEIILVIPGGPGPAELARQRRFSVYSSLENYARSLHDTAATAGQAKGNVRPGWLFPRKQKSDTPAAAPPPALTRPAPVVLQPLTPALEVGPAEAEHVPASMGDHTALSSDRDGMAMPADQKHGATVPSEDEEDGFQVPLPPLAFFPADPVEQVPTVPVIPQAAPQADTAGVGNGPGIIELSPRKTGDTGKMPAPSAQADQQPTNLSPKRRNSGKMAAVGAAGVAGTAAATTVAFGARRTATGAGMGAATMAQTAPGSTAVPPGGTTGPGGPGGPAKGNRGRNWLIAAGLALLTLLLIFGTIAYAAPGMFSHFAIPGVANTSTATVTITPATKTVKNTYVITAITGKPGASQRQVQARILSTSPSQSQTVKATGVKQTPGARATGSLTFYNGSTSPFTVAANTLFVTGSGIQLVNNVAASIPAANPPSEGSVTVPAHAVNVGTSGNIPALAINATCCVSGNYILVKNLSAFSGGQDPQNYTFLQQSDVDAVATPLEQRLMSSAQANLKGQKRSGEQFVNTSNPITCNPTVTANPPVGSKASSATVTVQVACSGEVYDEQGALAMAANLYKNDSTINPGAGFALAGPVSTSLTQASVVDNKGTVSLLVAAQGTWVYQTAKLVAQEKTWAKQIAGKSKQQAIAYLQSQPGVGKATIAFSGNTLPTDPNQISFTIQNVPVAGTPTPGGPSSSPVSGSPASGTPTPTPTSQNGLGSNN
jgi:hypothetical protein